MIKKITFALILIILSLSFVSAGEVNDTSSDFVDLNNRIELTSQNQTLNLDKDYQLDNDCQKHIVIDKSITIDGNNHTISSSDSQRIFWVKADNVVIKNINFINSKKTGLAGGVISWWGNNGTLKNCNFTNNSASSAGGAVLWKGDSGTICNCNFINNTVEYGSAVTLVDGEGFNKSMMHIQVVNSEGGALYISGNNVSVDNCIFSNNIALLNGGAISTNGGNISISNSRFKSNIAHYNGGAIDLNSNNAVVINSSFTYNSPKDIFNNCKNTTIISSSFKDNDSVESWYDINYYNVTYEDMGYFEELSLKINSTPEGGALILDKDYEYLSGSNKGILINKSITIDGNGHTLNGKVLSRMFNITGDNVILKNINFINGNAFGQYYKTAGGGALYWSGANGLIENCNFTNNSGSGIEDDPFDSEETYTDENGMTIHIVRIRPMGAKINEGGAIVWSGANGTVSKCRFIHNTVGYPNTGGAICWRGHNGKIIGSEFYLNDAWCGSAIAWIGSNGTILNSIIANSSFFDGGIYWFGSNGTIRNSVLLSSGYRVALAPFDADVNADYNFWGDTLENPNQTVKITNISNWVVMKFTHNGEFVKKGQKIIIKYDITNLYENGTFSKYDGLIDKSGQFTFTASKDGFLNITFKNSKINVEIDSKVHIVSKSLIKYYSKTTSFKVNVYDVNGKVAGEYVKFTINHKNYWIKTNKNGVATLKLKLKPGKYTIYSSYGKAKVKNKITVRTTLITKNVKVKKNGKFTVKVLNSKGKAYAKKSVKIKFKGKTYKIKTNKKGIAVFKLPKKLKPGKYTIKTTYGILRNSNKITVKK